MAAIKIPPFKPVEGKFRDKPYGEADAQRHADMIAKVWREAGHDVRPQVECVGHGNNIRWVVRMPQLVNGLPVMALAKGDRM